MMNVRKSDSLYRFTTQFSLLKIEINNMKHEKQASTDAACAQRKDIRTHHRTSGDINHKLSLNV